MKDNKGIIGAGNWILDTTKTIDVYPEQDTLANILDQESNNGGAAYNVLKDLAKLGVPFPLYGIGLIGNDGAGQYILEDCRMHGIDTTSLKSLDGVSTSYTDVMLVKSTGRRTFFHHRGANALLDREYFNFDKVDARILHLGYLLLLDRLDEFAHDKRTRASLLLEEVKNKGMITSVDLVSESSDRFRQIIMPSLPYIDYLFLNEFEAGKLTGVNLSEKNLSPENIKQAIQFILNHGVNEWVILHFPQGVMAGNRKGDFIFQGSLDLPPDKIAGTTGAGDAFAAGVLFGIHEGWPLNDSLELGVCSAASCLSHVSCSEGIIKYNNCLELRNYFGYTKSIL